jgi:hypothetical protein
LCGVCCLVKPTMQFFPPLLLIASFAIPAWRQWRGPALTGVACFALVLAPWIIRNQTLAKDPSQPSLMVSFLHHGSYPGFMYDDDPASLGIPYRFNPDNERISKDVPSVLRYIAGRFRAEPARYARWYLFGKPGTLFSWDNIEGVGDIYLYPLERSAFEDVAWLASLRAVAHVVHWPLVLLGGLSSLLVLWRPGWLGLSGTSRAPATLVALVVLYAVGFHMIGAPYPRYGIPFRPLLFALAMLPLRALAVRGYGAFRARD